MEERLTISKIQQYIYQLATGKKMDHDDVPEYEKLVLVGPAMPTFKEIWNEFEETNKERPVQLAALRE